MPYSLVPMPAPVDPMQSVGNLLQLAQGLEGLKTRQLYNQDQQREADTTKAVQTALGRHRGDLDAAAKDLEGAGQWNAASMVRTKAVEYRKALQGELAEKMKTRREALEGATRYLQGVEAAPEAERGPMFDAVRPRLVELLPDLQSLVPKTLADDPHFLTKAIPFGLSASEHASRLHASVDALNKKVSTAKQQGEIDTHVMDTLRPLVPQLQTGEELTGILDTVKKAYAPSDVVFSRLGQIPTGPLTDEWKTDAVARLQTEAAKPPQVGTFGDYLTTFARDNGKTTPEKLPLSLYNRALNTYAETKAREAGRLSTGDRSEMVSAVLKQPAIWKDLSPTVRGELAPDLSRAGFDFKVSNLTASDRRQVEQWRQNALTALNKQRRDENDPLGRLDVATKKTTAEADALYQSELQRIEDSYRLQMGLFDQAPNTGQSRGTPVAAHGPVPPKPAQSPPALSAGQIVTLKNGQRVKVGQVYADGTFDSDPTWKP